MRAVAVGAFPEGVAWCGREGTVPAVEAFYLS
jgi:hypothetical protein